MTQRRSRRPSPDLPPDAENGLEQRYPASFSREATQERGARLAGRLQFAAVTSVIILGLLVGINSLGKASRPAAPSSNTAPKANVPRPKVNWAQIDRGLAVVVNPPGFQATLYADPRKTRTLLVRKDTLNAGWLWVPALPSASIPAGLYTLELAAPGRRSLNQTVRIQAGRPTILGRNQTLELPE
ncbi:hypothetical protein [Leptolyngbya sp. FACHB-261]|uniref:hypothetical protein n=1 Tax=Leptolyngbya sp. FACHB-261 TaxID=2692806 RepID=UPI00168696A4|nr:hypothetical protein [Leptolyngbya sp. FACHB-261]MBD2100645.1 hypothetical protein [Leptolyngbya sp. FACHB-261]